jgi:hypothetical protein
VLCRCGKTSVSPPTSCRQAEVTTRAPGPGPWRGLRLAQGLVGLTAWELRIQLVLQGLSTVFTLVQPLVVRPLNPAGGCGY